MNWTTRWHHGRLRLYRAHFISCVILTLGIALFGQSVARAIMVDDGVIKTPASVPTTTGSMPLIAGSNLSAAGTTNSNLGTFDIVLVPSAALSSNGPALAAFNRAAQNWEAWISDPITVTINADFSALGAGILGSTSTVLLNAPYNTIRNQMVVDASDEADDGIVASLPTAAQFSGTLPAGFSFDGNVVISKANAKAAGFTGLDGSFGVSDASIAFSTGFPFDFDKSNGITAGQYDFEGVATHEIGHALGFISAVDDVDFLFASPQAIEPYALDLFRFRDGSANDPSNAATFTTAARDFVPGAADIFDQINGGFGGSTEVLFSTGVAHGDGRQASHWKDNLGLGIMDPTAAPGELLAISQNDLRAFDLIGYDIAVVPEPGSLMLLVVGGALTLAGRRRK